MDPFATDPQIEELMEFGFFDDETTKFEVEDYYDYDDASESSFNELLASGNDFWSCLTFCLSVIWLFGMRMVSQLHWLIL